MSCCSVAKLCPTLWDPMDYSIQGSPVLHYLPEFAQIHVHWVGDAIELTISSSVTPFSFCLQRTEEPGGLQSMESQRAGHVWVTDTFTMCLAWLKTNSRHPQSWFQGSRLEWAGGGLGIKREMWEPGGWSRWGRPMRSREVGSLGENRDLGAKR